MTNGLEKGSEVARALMQNMGWREGEGLGKDKQGIRAAIKPTKKTDNHGVGSIQSSTKWIAASCTYDNILAKLNIVYNKEEEEGEDPSSASSESEVEENQRKKRRISEKKEKKEEKKSRKSKGRSLLTVETKVLAEESITVQTNSRRAVFSKRLAAKQTKNYTSEAKSEIFGGREGFTEETQVNIYNAAMDKQIKGRKGLGLSANMSKGKRKEVAIEEARMLREGSYLARKFVYGGQLMDSKNVEEEEDLMEEFEHAVEEMVEEMQEEEEEREREEEKKQKKDKSSKKDKASSKKEKKEKKEKKKEKKEKKEKRKEKKEAKLSKEERKAQRKAKRKLGE